MVSLEKYANAFWPRVHEIQLFGQKDSDLKKIMDKIRKEQGPKVEDLAKVVYADIMGRGKQTPFTKIMEQKVLGPLRKFNVIRLLGGSPTLVFKQFGQIMSAAAKFGILDKGLFSSIAHASGAELDVLPSAL